MSTALPQALYEIINLLAELIRLIGAAALGVAIGYLVVDLLHKAEGWPMQAVIFLGLIGLLIALVVFLAPAALGGFGIGLIVAIFLWGIPRKPKEEQEK